MVILRQNQKYQAKRSMHTCSIRLRKFSITLQVANVLVANLKNKTKKQVKSTFQTTVDTNCQWVCPFTGNNFYQTVVFFFPVDVHNVHIPDWIQCTDESETLPFFFFKQPPNRQVEKMVHTSTSQLEANQRKWF